MGLLSWVSGVSRDDLSNDLSILVRPKLIDISFIGTDNLYLVKTWQVVYFHTRCIVSYKYMGAIPTT